jgi:hypothetical protein
MLPHPDMEAVDRVGLTGQLQLQERVVRVPLAS